MDSEESILANRICGCATNQQHSADIAAIREYRANVVAPFLARIEQLEARVRELEAERKGEDIKRTILDRTRRALEREDRATALSDLIAANADLIYPVCDETEGDCA